MKIESVTIKNFRSFKDETILFDDYCCLVGPNGGGKSNVLSALNVFFRNSDGSTTDVVNLVEEDFHHKDTSVPVEVTVTLTDLSDEAKEDFRDYFRQGKLIISAVADYDDETEIAAVKQYGSRMGMEDFRQYFEAESGAAKVTELKEIYAGLKGEYSDLPTASTKDAMATALREYESEKPELCAAISSEDQFYGVSKGANKLSKYLQWVYIPAVKDVTEEQDEGKNTALGKILSRTVRQAVNFDDQIKEIREKAYNEYATLLAANAPALAELEAELEEKLGVWAHPGASVTLGWKEDSKKSVQIEEPTAFTKAGESGFEGDLARLGNGFQRSYLLAMLQILSSLGDEGSAPRLILGCEEPELYQHPPQERHLATVLEQLSQNNAQVLVTTHEPAFVTGKGFENVRLIRYAEEETQSKQSSLTFENLSDKLEALTGQKPVKPDGVLAKLHQTLQPAMSEIFFTKKLVLVEGLEDVAIINSWMLLSGKWDEFRQKGIHIVPANGKSHLIFPLAIAQEMGIPVFVVFDADSDIDEPHRSAHANDNIALLSLVGESTDNNFPEVDLKGDNHVVWSTNITSVVEGEIPEDKNLQYNEAAARVCGHAPGMKKNGYYIAAKLEAAHADGTVIASVEDLCQRILKI